MATPESIAIRRADALTRVEAALGQIATQTGAEIAPYPEPHKRPEVRPAIEAEWLADALEAVSNAPDYGDALQRLVGLAVSDEMVRLALTEAGYIQSKESEDGVSVSIVGLGPDLFAEPVDDATDDDSEQQPEPTLDLKAMKRADLDAHAASLGIEGADKLPNRDAVIAAINAKKGSA